MGVIVITGGSRGIGAAAAVECARQGFGVILTYRDNERAARSVVARIEAAGGRAVALLLDVADLGSFAGFRSAVQQKLQTAVDAAMLEQYAIILMDIEMPRMNGLEATAKIREWERQSGLPSIPIVGISGNARQVRQFTYDDTAISGCISP